MIIFNSLEAGISTDTGKYVVVLEFDDCGYIGPSFTSIPKARKWYKAEIEKPSHYWAGDVTKRAT